MNLLSRSTIHDLETSSAAFRLRDPFRHVVIESFFESSYANDLLAQFPAFERGNARNEAGELAGKAVVERIRELGPAYRALDDLVQSRPFLDWLASVTGIPDLLYDPYYFGGGTHENRQGQALDAHVDFNRHPIEPWHRRLNLIVYLNPEWQEAWGGTLQLHSDPRSPDDRTLSIVPRFNRCVIFETTEWSWHGFPPISLPAAHADLTRRSIALYFYTTSRPPEELADPHSTIYVDRPLPDRFEAGLELSESDAQELRALLRRRDMHLQRLYRDLQDLEKQRDAAIVELHVGVLGRLRRVAGRILRGMGLRRPGKSSSGEAYVPALAQPALADAAVIPAPAPERVPEAESAYEQRIAQENATFADQVDINALPEIFHDSSSRYLLPMQQPFGVQHPEDFSAKYSFESAQRTSAARPYFVSLGSDNCDAEFRIAQNLVLPGPIPPLPLSQGGQRLPPPTLESVSLRRFESMSSFLDERSQREPEQMQRIELEQALFRLATAEPVDFVCAVHGGAVSFSLDANESPNWREGLICPICRLNARMRFSMSLLLLEAPAGAASRVYLTEQATFGFVAARRLFANPVGSEYVLDPERRRSLSAYLRSIAGDDTLSLRHEDATRLGFSDESFDAVGSFEVLEHIPDYGRALTEFARVLRPGGALVLTAPFLPLSEDTLVRARLRPDGSIEHLLTPEYHGDPVADQGVLCYYHFGWDLLGALRSAGFTSASVVVGWSPALGYLDDVSAIVAKR